METLKEYRCKNCKKIMFFGEITEGSVSKDCPKCGCRNVVTVKKIVTIETTIALVKKTNDFYKMPPKRITIIKPVFEVLNPNEKILALR